jgi:hypothetical protein
MILIPLSIPQGVGQRANFTTRFKFIPVTLGRCHPWHLIGREAVPFNLPLEGWRNQSLSA